MDMKELVTGCRTYRKFLQDPIPREALVEMIENVRLVNSARNAQPLHYTVVTKREDIEAIMPLTMWAGAIPNGLGRPKEDEYPVAFIMISKLDNGNAWNDVDLGIAADTLCKDAWLRGYGSAMLGAINGPKIAEYVGLKEGFELKLAIALGKPAIKSTVVDVKEDGSLTYYVDEDFNYYVPKRPFEEIVDFI